MEKLVKEAMSDTDMDLQVKEKFEELIKEYKGSNHRQKFEVITKAFQFAYQAHKGTNRRSGEPYIMHPLEVALIACREIGLGSTSIAAALLHDVVEDTDYTVEDISNLFGEKVAEIVQGLTKMSGGIFAEAASAQAENMRKLLLTMSSDIRVILIKIADRLHNMRTLGSLLPAKQYKIAGETMYLYAPLAHRLGLFAIKTELEDLSFKYEHPEEYAHIEQALQSSAINRNSIYEHFAFPLVEKLDAADIKYEMKARIKSVYSIWSKMRAKNVSFSEIYDLFAVRIVFDSQPELEEKKQCWDIYSMVTDLYELRPDRIRDWVSRPKANGYQALHLTVMGPDGQWIEVQIRSRKMDDIAEKGFSAHWKYKEHNVEEETELDKWLETIQEILEDPNPNALDFMDTIKLNLYADEIFVFTPKGDIKTMPQNSTALDFAYELHSKIGNHSIGAKVNHKLVPLSHKLLSGDQVEILTSRSQKPKEEWLDFVTTAISRTKIETALKKIRRDQIKKGEIIFNEFVAQVEGILDPNLLLNKMICYFGFLKKDDLYYALSQNQIAFPANPKKFLKEKSNNMFARFVKQAFGATSKSKDSNSADAKYVAGEKIDKKKTYILREEAFNQNYTVADCCSPISGDEVLGFLTDENSLIVHKRACVIALKLKSSFGERIISCQWAGHKSASFQSSIELHGIDSFGILNQVTKVVTADLVVNITKINIETKDGFFEGLIDILVHDVDDINVLCGNILKIKGVKRASRVQ
ncbi:bifunctional (p)ppGpp synthase/hydrolase SpoT [Bacteroidales bacterium]|nr:bifunctional (p)ppGpp synthase/hydrolase SpoT [Bacteroidales bacterium]